MSTTMTTYDACSIVEGFSGEEHTLEEHIEAWAYLIKTGAAWRLQGWYGRAANDMIEQGIISKAGKIDWDRVAELQDE